MRPNEKLYLVTRADLPPGSQAVQSAHALRQFVEEHPEVDREWFTKSNYLCMLAVQDEDSLKLLFEEAEREGIRVSSFREPDLNDALTALALEPSRKSQALCSTLPLALRSA